MKLNIVILSALGISATYLNKCNEFSLCKDEKSAIVWRINQKLEWKDFIGTMPKDFQYSVNSSIKINLDYKIKKNKLKFNVCTLFFKNDSYYRNDLVTIEYVLNHEQKHFDIGEIYARVLRKKLLELSANKTDITPEIVYEIFGKCNEEFKKMQLEYDIETNRSMIFEKQEIWDIKVEKMLDSLNKYK